MALMAPAMALWCIICLHLVTFATVAEPSAHSAASTPQHHSPTSCDPAADPAAAPAPGCSMQLVLAPVSDSPIMAQVAPGSKWAWCDIDGRSNMQFQVSVTGPGNAADAADVQAASVYVTVLAGRQEAQACNALAPAKCRGLYGTTCTGSKCTGDYPGELSGRLKCILVMNSFCRDTVEVTTSVRLQPSGNWRAIIAGVVLVTLVLLGVVAVGCYIDITASMKSNARSNKQRQRHKEPLLQH